MRVCVPFLACGELSGWDADKNYDLVLQPLVAHGTDVRTGGIADSTPLPHQHTHDTQQQQQPCLLLEDLTLVDPSPAKTEVAEAAHKYISLDPVQPPTAPAYKTAKELQKRLQQQSKPNKQLA